MPEIPPVAPTPPPIEAPPLIAEMPAADYSEIGRMQTRMEGYTTDIRPFDPKDGVDARQLKALAGDLGLTDKQYLSWMEDQGPGKNRLHHLFGVSKTGVPEGTTQENRTSGQIRGAVDFRGGKVEEARVLHLAKEGILQKDDIFDARGNPKKLFEMRYFTRGESIQMEEGIQQANLELSRKLAGKNDMTPEFMSVVTYVDANDAAGKELIEASGFVRRGTIQAEGGESQYVYTVDWNEVNHLAHTKAISRPESSLGKLSARVTAEAASQPDIDKLPYKNYSAKDVRRVSVKIAGSNAAIRSVDTGDKRDMVRLRMYDRATLDSMDTAVSDDPLNLNPDSSMTNHGLESFVKNKEDGLVVGIVATDSNPRRQEWSEIQGLIYTYPPAEPDLIESLQQKGVLPGGDAQIWEMSWAKKPGARGGQVGAGVRNTIQQIRDATVQFEEVIENGQVVSVKPRYPITLIADIEPNNIDSQRVARAAGFEHKKGNIWAVNWETYDQIVQKKIDEGFWNSKMDMPLKSTENIDFDRMEEATRQGKKAVLVGQAKA